MHTTGSRHGFRLPVGMLLLLVVGCQDGNLFGRKEPPPEKPPAPRGADHPDPLIRGTIGSQTLLTGVDREPLRGFGVVVGLQGRGSSDCPAAIRDYLIEFLTKQVPPQGSADRRTRMTPSQLIDSEDTAVVQVWGVVPPGAPAGTHFDLRVETVPGSATSSLAGGLLLPTQLRFFDVSASGQGMFAGTVLAEGGGPVFVNPFAGEAEVGSAADPRRGLVLGGGRSLETRTCRLMLLQPNYALARSIERRINERFGMDPGAASALSKGYIVLTTPPAYARRPDTFRDVVVRLYLDKDPAALERQRRELQRLITTDPSSAADISLAWEGLGRTVIPFIRPLYAHADPLVRFYAARAGLRLGDPTAVSAVGAIAADAPHDIRLLAIQELGYCPSPQASLHLLPQLDRDDADVRIAAYEALLRHGHPTIESIHFPHLLDPAQLNFSLDIVPTDASPMIYVRRTRVPRIAVFGRDLSLFPPVFYTQRGDALTVHTVAGADDIRVFCKRNNRLSDEVAVPPRVTHVIAALAHLPVRNDAGELRGMGLSYARVVQALADLCGSDTIAAPLVLEQTPLAELIGPETVPERRETDDDPDDRPDFDEPGDDPRAESEA